MFLIDTNIVSELIRLSPNPAVLRWCGEVEHYSISAVTVEELWFGVSRRPTPRLRLWLEHYFHERSVLPVDDRVARRAGELRGELSARGIVRHQADMLIAATAQLHGLTLATRNVRDFEGCGIAIVNPFDDLPPA